jgi:hypothetical protein
MIAGSPAQAFASPDDTGDSATHDSASGGAGPSAKESSKAPKLKQRPTRASSTGSPGAQETGGAPDDAGASTSKPARRTGRTTHADLPKVSTKDPVQAATSDTVPSTSTVARDIAETAPKAAAPTATPSTASAAAPVATVTTVTTGRSATSVPAAVTHLLSEVSSALGVTSSPSGTPSAPVQAPILLTVLAFARREFGATPAATPPAQQQAAEEPVATTARTAMLAAPTAAASGTTTPITWAWGTNPVLNFNPATDKLDFNWMQPSQFQVTEKSGSTVISVVDNNHSYTLQGVSISQLTMSNIVAKDAATVAAWQTLIKNAQPTQPTITIGDASRSEGASGSAPLAFTVSLSKASSTPVTVK